METKKFQIFVSSTFKDLRDTRRQVIEAINRMNQFAVGMELFSADDDEQWQIIKETIEQSDYYVCIIGHRYGSLSKQNISFTEREWDYAQSLGVPIMTFVRVREAATTPHERDSDVALQNKLAAFIRKATDGKMVDEWEDPPDLIPKVVTALFKAFQRKPRPGWIRADSSTVAEQLAIVIDENRNLRRQVEKLSSEFYQTSPKFQLLLNGNVALALSHKTDAELQAPTPHRVTQLQIADVPKHLTAFVDQAAIQSYNQALPSADTLKRINDNTLWYHRMSKTRVPLAIAIINNGSAKAREVYVDIFFPDNLWVIKQADFDDYLVPELRLPPNPIEVAGRRLISGVPVKTPTFFGGSIESLMNLPQLQKKSAQNTAVARTISGINLNYSLTVIHKERKVSIWIRDLMHTRQHLMTGLLIIPLSKGSSTIKSTVICEELPSPNTHEFAVDVK